MRYIFKHYAVDMQILSSVTNDFDSFVGSVV